MKIAFPSTATVTNHTRSVTVSMLVRCPGRCEHDVFHGLRPLKAIVTEQPTHPLSSQGAHIRLPCLDCLSSQTASTIVNFLQVGADCLRKPSMYVPRPLCRHQLSAGAQCGLSDRRRADGLRLRAGSSRDDQS